MKIARVDVFQVDLPYAGGLYRLSGGRTYERFDATIVRLVSDDGVEGWGESAPFGGAFVAAHGRGVRAGLTEVAPAVLGVDPRYLDRLNDAMDAVLVGRPHAKTPIDVAAWDLFGESVELPVCDLLGGRVDEPVAVIASIHADAPERMRAAVDRHGEMDFLGHSLKIGADDADGGPSLDADRIEAGLADRRSGEWFKADANGGMTVEHAMRLVELLPRGADTVLEAPCATWRETLSLRRRCLLLIMIDELVQTSADVAPIIADDAGDGVNLKISKQGGLTTSRRQRGAALSAGLVTSVQETVGSDVAVAALLHLAQSTPRRFLRCALDTRVMVSRSTAEIDAPIKAGGVHAPTAPGLGITPRRETLGDPVAVYEA